MFYDVHPSLNRTQRLTRDLDIQLLCAFDYLAEVCAVQGGLDVTPLKMRLDKARDYLNISDRARLPGSFVAAYTLLQESIQSQNRDHILSRISLFGQARIEGHPTRIIALGSPKLLLDEASDLTKVFRQEMERSGQDSSIFDPADSKLVERSMQAASQALEVISIVAPSLSEEISQLITDILIIDSSKTNAASSFQTFGVIFLKTLQPFQTWTTYVEHIVHEAAHHLLFAIFNDIKVFEDREEGRFKSPLRSDLRPLDAVFHAMFVITRILYILRKIYDSKAFPTFERTATYSFFNPSPLIDQFWESYYVIANNAKLTSEGIELLEGIKRFAETYNFQEQPLINR